VQTNKTEGMSVSGKFLPYFGLIFSPGEKSQSHGVAVYVG